MLTIILIIQDFTNLPHIRSYQVSWMTLPHPSFCMCRMLDSFTVSCTAQLSEAFENEWEIFNQSCVPITQCLWGIPQTTFGSANKDQFHKSQNAPVPYPTMLHSEQKCAHFCSEWSIVGYGTGAFWDLWIRSITQLTTQLVGGHVSYPTGTSTATQQGLLNSLA